MNTNQHIPVTRHQVLTARQLRERYGVTPAVIAERCRPGGPWERLLPQVYLLHPGPPSDFERLQAALLYAGPDAMVTGLAALALRRFPSVAPLGGLPRVDVLVGPQRRLRPAGDLRVVRSGGLPPAEEVAGFPCAPVPRALADAVAGGLDDADAVRRLIAEAARGGHCEPDDVVRELAAAGLMDRPYVAAAVRAAGAQQRALAEDRLYAMVRLHGLPEPVWNVELRVPGGLVLGGVDAYWVAEGVGVAIAGDDGRDGRQGRHSRDDRGGRGGARLERMEALGISVLYVAPARLAAGTELEGMAAVVRTALVAAGEGAPTTYVVVTPR